MKYRVLKAGVTIRNVWVCLALLAGSYLASGLVNAAPITQPVIRSSRIRSVVVAPQEAPRRNSAPDGEPSTPAENATLSVVQSL